MEVFYIDSKQFNNKGLTKREVEIGVGRLVVDFIAEMHYGLRNREIIIENKKPRFKSAPIHFSISHSRNIVLAGFNTSPVGVDVEYLKLRNFGAILKYLKSEHIEASMESFYAFWTAYEAKIKLQEEPKSALTMNLLPEFILSVACSQSLDIENEIKIYEVKSLEGSGLFFEKVETPLFIKEKIKC